TSPLSKKNLPFKAEKAERPQPIFKIYDPSQDGSISQNEENREMLLKIKGMSIDSKPRKDGRYQGRYTDANGKQKSIYGKSREEVEAKLTKIANGETPKNKAKPEKSTLYAWLDEHYRLFRVPVLKSPASQSQVCSIIKQVKKLFPDKPLDKLDAITIQTTLMNVEATAQRCKLFSELNAAFDKAVKLRKLKFNPCEAVIIPSHENGHRAALTLDEQTRFLKTVRTDNGKYSFLMLFLLATGTRIEEALALTKDKFIPFGDGYAVRINAAFIYLGGKNIIKQGSKTQSGTRVIPVSEKLYNLVMRYAENTKNNERIFNCSYKSAYSAIKKICADAGITTGALHTLRHTYSTRLEEMGLPEIIRGYLLGHKGQNITNATYTDVQAEYLSRYIPTITEYIDALFDTKFDTKK
ncbi:MAG: site-specific integrase, partial [Clostridiales bacterium]|nr:site-specific integrase [Clostridiales bacterium]